MAGAAPNWAAHRPIAAVVTNTLKIARMLAAFPDVAIDIIELFRGC